MAPEPAYPFIVQFDGHPHPARLSDDLEHLLIRVYASETGPVEHAQAIGGPVASVVRDLWAALGQARRALGEYADLTREMPILRLATVVSRLSDLRPQCEAVLQDSTLSKAGAEWWRLATENAWRLPIDRPSLNARVEVLRSWGGLPQQAIYFPTEPSLWLTDRNMRLRDVDVVAWRLVQPVPMPEGWPGSAPAPSPSSGGADEAGNPYTLEGGA
jgi:hypothetical protein